MLNLNPYSNRKNTRRTIQFKRENCIQFVQHVYLLIEVGKKNLELGTEIRMPKTRSEKEGIFWFQNLNNFMALKHLLGEEEKQKI